VVLINAKSAENLYFIFASSAISAFILHSGFSTLIGMK